MKRKKKKVYQKKKKKSLRPEDFRGIRRRKRSRERERERERDRSKIAAHTSYKKSKTAIDIMGTFRGNRRGFGFVTPLGDDGDSRDIFIPEHAVHGAMDGDTVGVRLMELGNEDHRAEGVIVVDSIVRAHENVVGTARIANVGTRRHVRNFTIITPDDDKIPYEFVAEASGSVIPNAGDKVFAQITVYPDGVCTPRAMILENLGASDTREACLTAILRENGIPERFPDEVVAEAEEVARKAPRLTPRRRDLTDTVIFTIDGADAKDLDDAVSVEKLPDGWRLGVHIADVSYYVRPNSALDREAFARGTSVYFADRVIPMLPTALSNGICSLNAGVRRYAQSAFLTLDKKGGIRDCELAETLICSRVRGVYSEVNDIFKRGKRSAFYPKYEQVARDLKLMRELYGILAKKSAKRGALELETSEAQIVLNENGDPVDIVKRERGDAEKMIEQFMLCANEGVATFLHDRGLPCVYRVHDDPLPDKLDAFVNFADRLRLPIEALRHASKPSPADFAATLNAAAERGVGELVSNVALRSLAKARYSASQSRHFGLGIENYCHFTSPIRRYPDLAVHRIVKSILRGDIEEKYRSFAERAARESSENELRAIAAERAVDDLYRCVYLSEHIGEEFDAVISSVTSFGFFAELANTCEGLVRIASLDAWYDYDEPTLSLIRGGGESSMPAAFALGDAVRVRVAKCDIKTRNVDFDYVPAADAAR